jgi:SAM-dependent methyltransferase
VVNTATSLPGTPPPYVNAVRTFFDHQYATHPRYWWQGDNRYSLEPSQHTPFNALVLQIAAHRGPGRALDLGAGEGADAIRLAKLGYRVDAVEISPVACRKIERFARAENVDVQVHNDSILNVALPPASYDLVLFNGSLHYTSDKNAVLARATAASAPGAVHALALFSTATPLPPEHTAVPVFPEPEGGVVEQYYRNWDILLLAYDRDQAEHSHPGFEPHAHSYIKLIARRPEGTR